MSTNFTIINQERANLTKVKIHKIIGHWHEEAFINQMKLPRYTTDFFIYFLNEMNQQGVLLQSIQTISQKSGINSYGITRIIDKLVKLKVMYKSYGIVGIQNFEKMKNLHMNEHSVYVELEIRD